MDIYWHTSFPIPYIDLNIIVLMKNGSKVLCNAKHLPDDADQIVGWLPVLGFNSVIPEQKKKLRAFMTEDMTDEQWDEMQNYLKEILELE